VLRRGGSGARAAGVCATTARTQSECLDITEFSQLRDCVILLFSVHNLAVFPNSEEIFVYGDKLSQGRFLTIRHYFRRLRQPIGTDDGCQGHR